MRDASGAREQSQPAQVRYLASYLRDPENRARTMVVERPYVDRHFITEYQGYYATTLRPPSPKTTRIHLFATVFDEDQLHAWVEKASKGSLPQVRRDLRDAYIGFIVVRPLASAPIGRTVLRPYSDKNARCFGPPAAPHRVHLLGFTLKACGVQFHQQDQAVGACATAALWCALAVVMRRDGRRAPTPLHVTKTANQGWQRGPAVPASGGLELNDMLRAISSSGYAPLTFKPQRESDPDHVLFQLLVMTYLRSGIPVVLQLVDAGSGHALAAVGFRVSDDDEETPDLEFAVMGCR